jgi:hypothetical protein
MKGAIFQGYLSQCPVPTLSAGDIVVMGNLRAHKLAPNRRSGQGFTPLPAAVLA